MIPGENLGFLFEKHDGTQKIELHLLKLRQWKNDHHIFNNMPLIEVMKYIEEHLWFYLWFKNTESKVHYLSLEVIPNEKLGHLSISRMAKNLWGWY